ncbi:MAG TPA: GNAT family N-acetyltransferase [Rhizobiales bacterium]|nr:GNAT family N-acetyltransferase [Hyphomicrobiales bacterium]
MMEFAIGEARARNCLMVQLSTDKSRTKAHRFYHKLGFVSSHEGMKLVL